MNLPFYEEDDNAYIQGPDGIWYQLIESWEIEEVLYGEDYDYDYDYSYEEDEMRLNLYGLAEGNELSEIWDTYPLINMYSDIIADDFSSITLWLDIYYSESEGDYDWCYVSAEFDFEGIPSNGF